METSFDLKHMNLKLDMVFYEMDNLFSDVEELYNKNKGCSPKNNFLSCSTEFNSTQSTSAESFCGLKLPWQLFQREECLYQQCFQLYSENLKNIIEMVKTINQFNSKEDNEMSLDSPDSLNISVNSFASDDMVINHNPKQKNSRVRHVFVDEAEEEDSMWNTSYITNVVQEEIQINLPHSNISHVRKPSDLLNEISKISIKEKSKLPVDLTTNSNNILSRNKIKSKTQLEVTKKSKPGKNTASNGPPKSNECLMF